MRILRIYACYLELWVRDISSSKYGILQESYSIIDISALNIYIVFRDQWV